MTIELIGTGVELRLAGETRHAGVEFDPTDPRLEAQCFVEVVDGHRRDKWGGSMGFRALPAQDEDVTSALVRTAYDERESNLGGLLGDLRRADYDVTRWELYSLPFRVELSTRLAEALSGRWRERDPRPEGQRITLTST